MVNQNNTFVLSLGGSLVIPAGGIDTEFLIRFNKFIRYQISSKKRRFFIMVGGGEIMHRYRTAARTVRKTRVSDHDLDMLGIHATRLNAQLLRSIFVDIADPRIIKHYEIILKIDKPIAIAAGWKPGWSTDYDAVTLCQDYGIHSIIHTTRVDKLYTKDPNKFRDAQPLKNMSWKDYRRVVGKTWTPDTHYPFDPIASKLADELRVTVKFLDGRNLKNLARALDGKNFVGATIGG
jgi:uridylate kinase